MTSKKGKIIILGTGRGRSLKDLTFECYGLLMGTNELFCRIDYDPIIGELKRRGKTIYSLTKFYKKFNSLRETYKNMANLIIKEAKKGKRVVYLVPGHPRVCEYPSELIIKRAKLEGLEVEILPAVSFLDSIFIDAEFDPGRGMQFIAGSELFDNDTYKDLSPHLICVISCISNMLQPGKKETVYQRFIKFLKERYPPNHSIKIIYQSAGVARKQRVVNTTVDRAESYKNFLTVRRATCVILPRKRQ